jgi:hypothetical protein
MLIRSMLDTSKTVAIVALITITTLVSACATSPKVQVMQACDRSLSKEQIMCELDKLNTTDCEINQKKGINGTNVAAALFFWPGLIYTQLDASDARKLVSQRREYLTSLYNEKLAQEKPKSHRR